MLFDYLMQFVSLGSYNFYQLLWHTNFLFVYLGFSDVIYNGSE